MYSAINEPSFLLTLGMVSVTPFILPLFSEVGKSQIQLGRVEGGHIFTQIQSGSSIKLDQSFQF